MNFQDIKDLDAAIGEEIIKVIDDYASDGEVAKEFKMILENQQFDAFLAEVRQAFPAGRFKAGAIQKLQAIKIRAAAAKRIQAAGAAAATPVAVVVTAEMLKEKGKYDDVVSNITTMSTEEGSKLLLDHLNSAGLNEEFYNLGSKLQSDNKIQPGLLNSVRVYESECKAKTRGRRGRAPGSTSAQPAKVSGPAPVRFKIGNSLTYSMNEFWPWARSCAGYKVNFVLCGTEGMTLDELKMAVSTQGVDGDAVDNIVNKQYPTGWISGFVLEKTVSDKGELLKAVPASETEKEPLKSHAALATEWVGKYVSKTIPLDTPSVVVASPPSNSSTQASASDNTVTEGSPSTESSSTDAATA